MEIENEPYRLLNGSSLQQVFQSALGELNPKSTQKKNSSDGARKNENNFSEKNYLTLSEKFGTVKSCNTTGPLDNSVLKKP